MRMVLRALVLMLVLAGLWVAMDVYRNLGIARVDAKPAQKLHSKQNDALYALQRGQPFDFSSLADTYKYLEQRYDTADFRLPSLIRILYEHSDQVPADELVRMKQVLTGFKYWMDQPGEDSMCFWSENHQILFSSAEYLLGKLWPDDAFSNTGMSGAQHREHGRTRVLTWLEQRWRYGFTEWYSPVYYTEDVAPLVNLIDFGDEEVSRKAQIVLDLLLHDVASQSYEGTFISTSGRMYERQKIHGEGGSMRFVISAIWGDRYGYGEDRGMTQNFRYTGNYSVPEVIKAIGADKSEAVIKASTGLNLTELPGKGLVGLEDAQIMMQWNMESFSNPQVVENTVAYMNEHSMFANEFLHDLRLVNVGLLRASGMLPFVFRYLNPVTNGAAIQRANTYTWRTPDFMIATAQSYHPGTYGDQHHIWNAVLANDVSIFTTHPAKGLAEKGALSGSPGYWVGNGRLPHAAQDKNVVLVKYRIPEQPGYMESSIVHYTHAHFPRDAMDDASVEGNHAFGRLGNKYVAFTAKRPLHWAQNSRVDLIQPGTDGYWVFEASTAKEEGSFEHFKARIRENETVQEGETLRYASGNRVLELGFGGEFRLDGEVVDINYPRFDSPWARVEREPQTITITHGDKELFLDFYNLRREQRSRLAPWLR